MAISEYARYDALGLAGLVRRREVRPSELIEEAIRRIEEQNGVLNAVVHDRLDKACQVAREQDGVRDGGPFHGVPFLLKDLLANCKGLPATSGSRYLRGVVAPSDSTLVARHKRAGLIVLGKTNAAEFGLVPTTEPAAYGATRNPWNLGYSTGGSSGGSAAVVAAGIVPMAHANDGAGSIRIPASCCGLVGMKPTRARNPLGPALGDMMSGLVCEHALTRSVRDSAALLDCTAGPEPGDPYWAPPRQRPFLEEVTRDPGRLRIAYSLAGPGGMPAHAACMAAIEAAARLCEAQGHLVEEDAPALAMDRLTQAFLAIWAGGTAANLEAAARSLGRPPGAEDIEGLTRGVYERGRALTAVQYQHALALLQRSARTVARFHQRYDVWLTPTLGAPPPRNGVIDTQERDPDRAFAALVDYLPFVQNATGQPSVSLPLHWTDDGLPVGCMFTGRFGDEGLLYRLAGQLERIRPWIGRRPQIWD